MMQKHKCLIDFILTVASQIAYADLPLSLEELLTDKGKFKLESSISYINTERNQSEFANPIYVQTSATKIATVMAMMITPVMAQNLDSQVFALPFEQLVQLKIPVIVYLKYRKNNHFSVLNGINGETVLLADPSLGHVSMSKSQFLSAWKTRDGEMEGKILAIVPKNTDFVRNQMFFNKNPVRQTRFTVEQIQMRQKR